ncbi:PREDICTED: purine nucleoside phosphorylase-like [Nanorana parkeri]|uniref:purine nucleoside phosphorylase-like n=1 Tax=Nanorana parkeri TaxID=125878 RepID=UPI0008547C1B|nr:PREDICTED: purine nucleoside phosphorylase-like [Nanorana parkeri]
MGDRKNMQSKEDLRYDDCEETARWLLDRIQSPPVIAIICGSGLGLLADTLTDAKTFDYSQIPHFPTSTVVGHSGQLVFGNLQGKSCVVMKGRFHVYEGYPLWKVTLPIRVFKLLGVKVLMVTNAAGSLCETYSPGDFMIIRDHINMPGLAALNPLRGPNDERFGPRFPSLWDTYDQDLRTTALAIARRLGHGKITHEGVYCMVGGPNFESVAEARFLQRLGADAVGMSTAPEAVVAKHCGMRVFGLSLITNRVAQAYEMVETVDHTSVLEVGKQRSKVLQQLITELVKTISFKEDKQDPA